ncbi:MAG: radical SAM/SPASM domain-containing protein, partial [Archaeoglobaceae archaeon]
MIDKIAVFSHLINPVTRLALKQFTSYCEDCKKNRVEVALELFVGVREDACWKCKTAEKLIEPILMKGAETFNATPEEIKVKFKDPYWRKGLASVVKGLAEFGVRKPFVPGAPFQVVWDVTYACNLRCRHCYATAGKALNDELTTEEAMDKI